MIAGTVVQDDPADELRATIRGLRAELTEARAEAERARGEGVEAVRAVQALRRQLSGLYKALQAVFGEMEGIGGEVQDDPASRSGTTTREEKIWASWRERMPGMRAKIIEALLLQPGMNTAQLAIACHTRPQRISEAIVQLNRAGLIAKVDGRFSLKAI